MTDVPPPDAPDRDPFGRPVQPPPPGPPGFPPQQWHPAYPPHPMTMPPRPAGPEGSRTKALWALVLAILPLCLTWIAAAVLAIIVLAGPRDGQRRGRGMAWAALVIVVLWVVGSIVAAVVLIASVPADRDEDGNVTSGGEVFVTDLRVGDCIDEDVDEYLGDPETGELSLTLTVSPCDEPHTGEVYHEVELDAGTYPGETSVMDTADEVCLVQFEAWVGQTYERSELDYTYFFPTEDTWEYGDRLISCLVVSFEDVTESLEGSGR